MNFESLRIRRHILSFKQECHTEVSVRRAATLSVLSQMLYVARSNIPPGFKPDKHQLRPLDLLNRAWLNRDLLVGEEESQTPQYPRNGLLIADEGGMGKTLSAALVALQILERGGGVVLVVCPPMLIPQWKEMFKSTVYFVNEKLTAAQLARGNLRPGLHVISKHAIRHDNLEDEEFQRLEGKIDLLILDEAHEGFIQDAEYLENPGDLPQNDRLGPSLRSLSRVSKRQILATATPMRQHNGDLFSLLSLIDPNLDSSHIPLEDTEWIHDLGHLWLPALEDCTRGEGLFDAAFETILAHLDRFVPLPHEQRIQLENSLLQRRESLRDSSQERLELCHDLHPLGRYMSVTLRDDLGEVVCNNLYREMNTECHAFPMNQEYTELLDLLQNQYDTEQLDGANWPSIVKSCPLNILDRGRYIAARSIHNSSRINDIRILAAAAWEKDPRLSQLQTLIAEIIDADRPSKGLVIFTKWKGTIDKLQLALQGLEGVKVYKFSPPDETLMSSIDMRSSYLATARRQSTSGSILPVLICGDSGAVGLNMEWATEIVHWDAIRSVSILSQKTWRLDRRMALDHSFTNRFDVHHYFIESPELDTHFEEMNQNNSTFRLLLGDRRYFNGQGPELLPQTGDTQLRIWSNLGRIFSLSTVLCDELWAFIDGQTSDVVSVFAESMGLDALFHLTGIDFSGNWAENDEDFDGFEPPIDNEHFQPVIPRSELHILSTLTRMPHELHAIKCLAGGRRTPEELTPQSGRVLMTRRNPKLLPAPDGDLQKFFAAQMVRWNSQFTRYSFCTSSDNLSSEFRTIHGLSSQDSMKYSAHRVIFKLKSTPYWTMLKDIIGGQIPSGLMVKIGGGSWKHILESELDLHREVFRLTATSAKKNSFFESFMEHSLIQDREEFLSLGSVLDDFDPIRIENQHILLSPQGPFFILQTQKMRLELPNPTVKSDFLPLVFILPEDYDTYEDAITMPECHVYSCPGEHNCLDEWEINDEVGWC